MGNKSTTTQTADPWAPIQEPLVNAVGNATQTYNEGGFNITPYAGDWVANANRNQRAGRSGLLALGQTGNISPAIDAMSSIATTGVDFPTSGPDFNFDPQRKAVIDAIMPAINGTFAGSGMTGSTLHQQNLAKGLSAGMADAEMGFQDQAMQAQQQAFGQAAQMQQMQMGAAGMLPGMASAQSGFERQPYMDMMSIGDQQQAQRQAEIDALIQKDMLSQSADVNGLKDYLALLTGVGSPYATQSSTQQTRLGPLGILGGGLQVAGLL